MCLASVLLLMAGAMPAAVPEKPWFDPATHHERFVSANGVRFEVLDWGGSGPALIFLHGLGENPHIFDDIAPAFANRYRVIAYARRGHGRSDARGPYDLPVLTEDLRGLMDALGIAKATLVGWSIGGSEITSMAIKYPQRVESLIYFDGLFDYDDPVFAQAVKSAPAELDGLTPDAMTSLDAYRDYLRTVVFAGLDDIGRVEAYLRDEVVALPDGTVKPVTPDSVQDEILKSARLPREYARVQCRALAFVGTTGFSEPIADPKRRAVVQAFEANALGPFRARSIEHARRELRNLKIVVVPGAHATFFLVSRAQVVQAMREFLLAITRHKTS
ncbi:MAG: alpha/beta hydrolase [Rudaea sp.]|uniref:alpha/beta fold hydrolase n=1 Tax=Rudaea sp. TaxID=2136325 RepID=UPI0039E3EBDD